MKIIKGHTSWNEAEILQILHAHGEFTMCTLPQARYHRVQGICRNLQALGLIAPAGQAPNGINYVITDLFKAWRVARRTGTTTLGPVQWRKQQWTRQA